MTGAVAEPHARPGSRDDAAPGSGGGRRLAGAPLRPETGAPAETRAEAWPDAAGAWRSPPSPGASSRSGGRTGGASAAARRSAPGRALAGPLGRSPGAASGRVLAAILAAGLALAPGIAAGLALAAAGSGAAEAQTRGSVRGIVRQAARDGDVAGNVLGLTGFGSLPGVSASGFHVDGNGSAAGGDVGRFAASPSHRFEGLGLLGGELYAEATFGWFTVDATYATAFAGTRFEASPRSQMNSWTALGGVGLAFDLGGGFAATPIATLGWGKVEDDTTFVGRGAEALDRITDDLLFNWDVQELLYGPALQLDYLARLGGGVDFEGRGRLSWVQGETLSASSRVLKGETGFGVMTLGGTFEGPTRHEVAGRDLRWLIFGTGTWLSGDGARALGVNWLAEIGVGVKILDPSAVPQLGLQGASLSTSIITGEGAYGWSVAGALEF